MSGGSAPEKHRVEPRVAPWGQYRATRVSYELWTPHQNRGKRFAFSSISTGLRTDGSRDEYAPKAPTPGGLSRACSSCSKRLRKHSRPLLRVTELRCLMNG